VVSGFRSPEEIDFLRRTFSPQGRNFVTLFIEADEDARFQRLRARMRPGDDISLEDFRCRDLQQRRMGLEEIRLLPSVATLRNDGTPEAYLTNLERSVGARNPEEIDIRTALTAAASITDIRIEGAILIALLAVWRADETRPFYTTTQIAGLISSTLPNIAPKH